MYKTSRKSVLVYTSIVLSVFVFMVFIASVNNTDQANALTAAELQTKTEELEQEIKRNRKILHELEDKAATLQNRLGGIRAEIATAVDQIELTKLKIQKTQIELEATEKELEKQKKLLGESLRALYITGDITTVELLASSDTFTEFVDEQEYLERLKVGIQESVDEVEALKESLEKAEQKLKSYLGDVQDQRLVLENKKTEQNQLLAKTQGQESKYQDVLADLRKQREKAEAQLLAFLSNTSNFKPQGSVKQGTQIGQVGSSGNSTGPHIHFGMVVNGTFVNPLAGGETVNYNMIWPVPNSSAANISQGFGCTPYPYYGTRAGCPASAPYWHNGVDITGAYGDPVVAAGDGEIIFRGWNAYGFGNLVIIDHGGGVQTYYPHLLK